MNKIKYSVLLIFVLCISFSFGFAQVNDNSSTVKTGIGSFSASILIPLKIHDVQPVSIGPKEYVKGAEYILVNSMGVTPYCQYTIHGQSNKNMYVTVVGSTVGADGKEIKNDGNGVTLYITWVVDDGAGDYVPYSGNNFTPYLLFPQPLPANYGARVVTSNFTKLLIDAGATSGIHIFTQTISVSYNPF